MPPELAELLGAVVGLLRVIMSSEDEDPAEVQAAVDQLNAAYENFTQAGG